MKTGPLLAVIILAGCASQHDKGPGVVHSEAAVADNPYQVGLSTEVQVLAARGQPLDRSVAADGTITDIYSADGLKITSFQPPPGPDGKPSRPVDLAARQADLVVKSHYVYSPDGILRKMLLDLPSIGPNGEIVRHVSDMTGAKITITGSHKVQQ